MEKFYTLYDKQTGRYLQSGINSTSEEELKKAYLSYISIDTNVDEIAALSKLTIQVLADSNEFDVESSDIRFEEEKDF